MTGVGITGDNSNLTQGGIYTFSSNIYPAGVDIVSYEWFTSTGTTWEIEAGSIGPTVTIVQYSTSTASETLTLRVTDNYGNEATSTINLILNQPTNTVAEQNTTFTPANTVGTAVVGTSEVS